MSTPWDIYAKELLRLKLGYPLWFPEADEKFGEVRLGDIGYLRGGKFCFLFNCLKPVGSPVNEDGVPQGYKPFELPTTSAIIHCKNVINMTLDSQYTRNVEVDISAKAGVSSISGSVGLNSESHKKSGASLTLTASAHKTFLDCDRAIKDYVCDHREKWLAFACEKRKLDLGERDLVFVSGHTKTAGAWTATAWTSSDSKFTASAGVSNPVVSGNLSLTNGLSTSSPHYERALSSAPPPSPRTSPSPADHGEPGDYEYGHCIFLNFYAMRGLRGLRIRRSRPPPCPPSQVPGRGLFHMPVMIRSEPILCSAPSSYDPDDMPEPMRRRSPAFPNDGTPEQRAAADREWAEYEEGYRDRERARQARLREKQRQREEARKRREEERKREEAEERRRRIEWEEACARQLREWEAYARARREWELEDAARMKGQLELCGTDLAYQVLDPIWERSDGSVVCVTDGELADAVQNDDDVDAEAEADRMDEIDEEEGIAD